MAGSGGSAKQKQLRDKAQAAYLKRIGQERTSGRCPVCYQIISCDSNQSRYRHICPGGGRGRKTK
jgi:hypothetical protein